MQSGFRDSCVPGKVICIHVQSTKVIPGANKLGKTFKGYQRKTAELIKIVPVVH